MSNSVAPLGPKILAQLRKDAADVRAAAARKNITMDRYEEQDESAAAQEHFALGTWLFYYSSRVYRPEGLQDRIDCARRLLEAGIYRPGYQFFTVFSFGERQFDTIFEMGDADAVLDGLRDIALKDRDPNLLKAFEYMGWSLDKRQMALF